MEQQAAKTWPQSGAVSTYQKHTETFSINFKPISCTLLIFTFPSFFILGYIYIQVWFFFPQSFTWSMTVFSENNTESRWLNPTLRGVKQQIQVNFRGKDLPVHILEKQILQSVQKNICCFFKKIGRIVFRKSILETLARVHKICII